MHVPALLLMSLLVVLLLLFVDLLLLIGGNLALLLPLYPHAELLLAGLHERVRGLVLHVLLSLCVSPLILHPVFLEDFLVELKRGFPVVLQQNTLLEGDLHSVPSLDLLPKSLLEIPHARELVVLGQYVAVFNRLFGVVEFFEFFEITLLDRVFQLLLVVQAVGFFE